MTRDLLVRGMLIGVLAAIVATLLARAIGEPQIDLAIAFEQSHGAHAAHHDTASPPVEEEEELVSRDTQKGLGLLTALTLYGAAVGGIFALVFATIYGRATTLGPRSLALLLALGAFIAVALIPALKYPPTPPAVGQHETVAFRTIAYFLIIALSVVAMVSAVKLSRVVHDRLGPFNAMLAGAGTYILLIAIVQIGLPTIDEVPADFPAVTLWNFRIAAIAMQAALWLTIGVGFGMLADRKLRSAR